MAREQVLLGSPAFALHTVEVTLAIINRQPGRNGGDFSLPNVIVQAAPNTPPINADSTADRSRDRLSISSATPYNFLRKA